MASDAIGRRAAPKAGTLGDRMNNGAPDSGQGFQGRRMPFFDEPNMRPFPNEPRQVDRGRPQPPPVAQRPAPPPPQGSMMYPTKEDAMRAMVAGNGGFNPGGSPLDIYQAQRQQQRQQRQGQPMQSRGSSGGK